jgi:putative tryptophan/tyrosine transport system substrate-binding protein
MKRREFIALVGGAAVAWPVTARAQLPDRVRRLGLLLGFADENDPEAQTRITAFGQGLEALGWAEGRNIRIDYRFGGGDAARIQASAGELVSSAPDVIVANSSPAVAALKQATGTIPIVLAAVNDPVAQGFIASLARPGGKFTGFTLFEFTILGKWLELLKEMVPGVRRAALMFNPETAPIIRSTCVSSERPRASSTLSWRLHRCTMRSRSKPPSSRSRASRVED